MIKKREGDEGPIRAALISCDVGFRTRVNDVLNGSDGSIELGVETDAMPAALLRDPVTPLQDYDPHLLFLDLGPDPEDGIRLAEVLSRSHPGMGILVNGPELSQGQLLTAMRAGVSEVIHRGGDVGELSEALDRVMRKLCLVGGSGFGSPEGRILAFFSPKGGTGCTTVAMNVGIELHRVTGKKTLLVDLDLELGEMASFMGVRPRFHLVDLLKNFHRMDDDLLASYIERHESGVHLLSAPFEPEVGQAVTGEDVSGVLAYLRKHYDFVVVDASKSMAPPAMAALAPADEIHLVTNLDLCSLRNLKRCLPILREISGGKTDRLRLIVNRYEKNGLLSLRDLEATAGIPAQRTLRNDFQSVIESLSTGRPLVLHSNSKYAKELKGMAAEMAGRKSEAQRRGRPLLGGLFGKNTRPAVGRREVLSNA